MSLKKIFRFNSISKNFLIPTVIVGLTSLMGLGIVLMTKNAATFRLLLESKGKATADLLGRISAGSFTARDISALENYVKETLNDPDIAFIVYYDAEKKPLTRTSREPDDTASLSIQEREIRSLKENGRILGYLRIGYDRNALSGNLQSGVLTVAATALVVLTLLSFAMMAVIGGVARPLKHLVDLIEKAARGDLTAPEQTDLNDRRDEVGTLARSFAKMSVRLKGVIKKIQETCQQIAAVTREGDARAKGIGEGAAHQADAAAKTYSSFNEMNLSINKIVQNIDTLSSTAQNNALSMAEMTASIREAAEKTVALSTSVEETASSVSGMSGAIKEVAGHIDTLLLYAEEATASVSEMNASIEQVDKNAKESAFLAEKGSQEAAVLGIGAIEQTIGGMEQIKKTVEKSSYLIHKLDDRAKKIGDILTVIDAVTRQTNLLALNASILAAQAGNEGKGFAVVSNEMKNLADRTEASTTEIAQLIRDVQSDTTNAVESVKEGLESVEEGVRRSAHAKDSLTKIVEISERSSAMSRRIEKATLEQVKATNQMTQLMEKMSVMVMKINTAMSELENGTSNITRASQKMNSITQQVQTRLEDQVKGSLRISETGENVTVQIQQVAAAVNSRKKESETIIQAILEIQRIAQATVQTARQMNEAMEDLAGQANSLKDEAQQFKTRQA